MKKMRLDKIVSNMGYSSRSEVRDLIKQDILTIDGVKQEDVVPQMKVNPDETTIRVHGERVVYIDDMYVQMYKPAGTITEMYSTYEHESMMEYLAPEFWYMGLFPAGNTIVEAEGLVLLVNDGPLAHRLGHPKKMVEKTYMAEIRGKVTQSHIDKFKNRMAFEDYESYPMEMEIVERAMGSTFVHLKGCERKATQVLDMFERIDKQVISLMKLSEAGVFLDDELEPGEARILTPDEIEVLLKA